VTSGTALRCGVSWALREYKSVVNLTYCRNSKGIKTWAEKTSQEKEFARWCQVTERAGVSVSAGVTLNHSRSCVY
jgi:hypothetical protein